ncbi:MAG: hypothetical protein ACI9R3_005504, partial [Verrucomicrobiales bacterium]
MRQNALFDGHSNESSSSRQIRIVFLFIMVII